VDKPVQDRNRSEFICRYQKYEGTDYMWETGTVEWRLSRLIGKASHSDMKKIRIIGLFLIDYIGSLNWKKKITNGYFRVHIYLPTNKTLVRNSLHVFDIWGVGNLSHKKMRYNYGEKMLTGRAKPIRIIGDPDNQRQDKWSSTVLWCCEQSLMRILSRSLVVHGVA